MTPLVDIRSPDASRRWQQVDDAVVGGLSRSRMESGEEGVLAFTGTVAMAPGGGFASVRRDLEPLDLSRQLGLELRVRGDGRRYVASLRLDGTPDGVSWQARFTPPAGRWTTLRLPFSSFMPRWRGWVVGEAGALDTSRVRGVGLLIADDQSGPFRLELAELGTYAGWPASVRDAPLEALRWERRLLVVSDPQGQTELSELQRQAFLERRDASVDRELSLLVLGQDASGEARGLLDEQPLGASVEALRSRLGLPADGWSVALVGYDGEVKALQRAPVSMDAVLGLIDAMPRRRREVRQPHREGPSRGV